MKFFKYSLVGAMLFGSVFWAARLVSKRAFVAYAQAKVSPFTAERLIYSYTVSPDGKLVEKDVTAVDSTGSRSRIGTMSTSQSLDTASVYTMRRVERTDGLRARIVDDLRLVSSGYVTDTSDLMSYSIRAQSGCIDPNKSKQILGHESVAGVDTVILQDNGLKAVRITQWVAPELGCFALRQTNERQQSDGSYRLVSEYKLHGLTIAEPDRQLFEFPPDYQEVKPSEQERRIIDHLSVKPPAGVNLDRQWNTEDQEYDQRRATHK